MNVCRNTVLVFGLILLISSNASAEKLGSELLKAAKKGQIEKVQDLIEAGVPVNSTDKNGRTALMLAAEKGHNDVVQHLIDHEADVSIKDRKGETAIDKAEKKKNMRSSRY